MLERGCKSELSDIRHEHMDWIISESVFNCTQIQKSMYRGQRIMKYCT